MARSINLLKIDVNCTLTFLCIEKADILFVMRIILTHDCFTAVTAQHGMSIVYTSVGLMLIFFNTCLSRWSLFEMKNLCHTRYQITGF